MSCSSPVIIIGIYLLCSLTVSNGNFFVDYDLTTGGFLDETRIAKLKERYADCVKEVNAEDKKNKNNDIAEYMDIPIRTGSSDLNGQSQNSRNVALWPHNNIPTEFDSSVNRTSFLRRLECAILYFHSETCIRFVEKRDHHKNYLLITNNGMSCSSDQLGMKGGMQMVHIIGETNTACWRHGTIVHELMHVVGQFHEHQRRDRDQHIHIFHQHIGQSNSMNFFTPDQMGYNTHDDIGDYDFSSIMHYPSKLWGKRVIVATFTTYQFKAYNYTDQMGNRLKPTAMDTYKVNMRYGCGYPYGISTRKPGSVTDHTTLKTSTETTLNSSQSKPEGVFTKLYVTGGWSPYLVDEGRYFEYYYPEHPEYNKLFGYYEQVIYGHTSFVNTAGKVVIIGGKTNITSASEWQLNNAFTIDPDSRNGRYNSSFPHIRKSRAHHALGILNEIPYICGGVDGELSVLDSCERFLFGKWHSVRDLKSAKKSSAMTSLNGRLYTIGGLFSYNYPDNNVYRYTWLLNIWEYNNHLNVRRYHHSAAALRGYIYACGGYSETEILSSCERYNPSASTGQWSEVASMQFPRIGFSMVSDGRRLYAIGGCDKNTLRSVEVYEPEEDKWTLLKKKLIYGRCEASVVIV